MKISWQLIAAVALGMFTLLTIVRFELRLYFRRLRRSAQREAAPQSARPAPETPPAPPPQVQAVEQAIAAANMEIRVTTDAVQEVNGRLAEMMRESLASAIRTSRVNEGRWLPIISPDPGPPAEVRPAQVVTTTFRTDTISTAKPKPASKPTIVPRSKWQRLKDD